MADLIGMKPNRVFDMPKVLIFLLKREYLRECQMVQEKEDEKPKAIHPAGWSFDEWAERNGLFKSQIITRT